MTTRTCPACAEPMAPGRAYVAGTAAGMLAVGLSLQHLWFEPQSGPRTRVVESSSFTSNIVNAHRCPRCGGVFVEPGASGA